MIDSTIQAQTEPDLLLTDEPEGPPKKSAQGVICQPWALAFGYDWARTILDDAELSTVPKSPPWLRGALNFDGDILPVIDLAVYFSPDAASGSSAGLQRGERLLIGGFDATSQNKSEGALALVFSQRPQQLRYHPTAIEYMSALPERLQELCSAQAVGEDGVVYLEIDTRKLLDALGADLAAL